MAAGLEAAIQRMFPPPFMQAFPDVVTQRKLGLLKMDPSVFSHYCMALTNIDFEPLLPRIKNSVLVMVGALDGTTNPQLVQKLAAGIPGARFMTIQDSGHCPQIEQPKIFCRLIDEFLLPPDKAL